MGELGHVQGHQDDGFNVPNEDLASDVQSPTSSAFDDVAHLVAAQRVDGQDFVWVSVHSGSEKVEGKVPTVDEAIGVNAGEKAGQVLVVDERRCLGIEVAFLDKLDEFKDIAFGQVLGNAAGMSW